MKKRYLVFMNVLLVFAMAARRHLARVSATVLPPESSPFSAMCLVIGARLRDQYNLPNSTPSYMQTLLQELEKKEEPNPDRVE
jgi:hypothetical protein